MIIAHGEALNVHPIFILLNQPLDEILDLGFMESRAIFRLKLTNSGIPAAVELGYMLDWVNRG
jgi:hypothetical protein